MAEINWIQVGAGFLGGGAIGALIKQFFDYRKNRIQSITFNVDVKSFYNQHTGNALTSKIVIKDGDDDYKFQDLYVGSISILNTSNQDFPEFSFGLTYEANNKFIQIQQQDIDRHHSSTFNKIPSLQNQLEQFDILIKPFNRKDNYKFDFIVSVDDQLYTASEIKLSTSHPVKLKQVTTESELANLILKGFEISLPFMKISYTK